MTTRSSRSSLVGPPTTIREDEDDDSRSDDLRYQDENQPDWNTRPRYANDAVIEDLDNFARLSPPIERVITDFNNELDSLTRSFEAFSQRNGLIRNQLLVHMPFPSTAKKAVSPLREQDPPPSVEGISPLRNYIPSTPARRSASASYSTPYEPPPPAPVETPGFGFPTPNRNRNQNRTTTAPPRAVDEESSYAATLSATRYTHESQRPDNSDSSKMKELERKIREQEIRIQDLEIENEVLRKKLQLQRQPSRVEPVIRHSSSLVDHLRGEPQEKDFEVSSASSRPVPPPQPPTRTKDNGSSESSRLVRPPPPPTRINHRRYDSSAAMAEPDGASGLGERPPSDRSTVREEPEGIHQAPTPASIGMSHSPYRTQPSVLSTPSRRHNSQQQSHLVEHRLPRHIQTLSEAIEETGDCFTPGTRFVAQLATLMKLEKYHCAPLSVILDKHWDSLKHHFDHAPHDDR